MSEEIRPCPRCKSQYGYALSNETHSCPECGNEWNPNDPVVPEILKVIDSNGNELSNGDSVTLIKSLPVKGAYKPLKSGTKIKNIRLRAGDHNIECKIEGYGTVELKSEFVKKAEITKK